SECRTLMRVLLEGESRVAPSETQLKRIETRIIKNLKPVRPLASSYFFLFTYAIIFLCIIAIGATSLGAKPFDGAGLSALSTAQRIAVFSTLAASAVLLAISMVKQMVPGSMHALAPVALPFGTLTGLTIVLAAAFQPQAERSFVATGLTCMRNGVTYAIAAGVLLWLRLRRGGILYPELLGLTAGGLAGLVALSALGSN